MGAAPNRISWYFCYGPYGWITNYHYPLHPMFVTIALKIQRADSISGVEEDTGNIYQQDLLGKRFLDDVICGNGNIYGWRAL